MTVRERVLASRIIQRIEQQSVYANKIGLSGNIRDAKIKERPSTKSSCKKK